MKALLIGLPIILIAGIAHSVSLSDLKGRYNGSMYIGYRRLNDIYMCMNNNERWARIQSRPGAVTLKSFLSGKLTLERKSSISLLLVNLTSPPSASYKIDSDDGAATTPTNWAARDTEDIALLINEFLDNSSQFRTTLKNKARNFREAMAVVEQWRTTPLLSMQDTASLVDYALDALSGDQSAQNLLMRDASAYQAITGLHEKRELARNLASSEAWSDRDILLFKSIEPILGKILSIWNSKISLNQPLCEGRSRVVLDRGRYTLKIHRGIRDRVAICLDSRTGDPAQDRFLSDMGCMTVSTHNDINTKNSFTVDNISSIVVVETVGSRTDMLTTICNSSGDGSPSVNVETRGLSFKITKEL